MNSAIACKYAFDCVDSVMWTAPFWPLIGVLVVLFLAWLLK